MGAALVWLGLGLVPVTDGPWRQMFSAAGVGAAIYVATVALAWLAAGRPEGPERDLATLAVGVARKLRGLLPRPAAARS